MGLHEIMYHVSQQHNGIVTTMIYNEVNKSWGWSLNEQILVTIMSPTPHTKFRRTNVSHALSIKFNWSLLQ